MPYKKDGLIHVIAWSFAAILVGVVFSAGVSFVAESFYGSVQAPLRLLAGEILKTNRKETLRVPVAANSTDASEMAIPELGKAVRVDLERRDIALYEKGALVRRLSALAVPDAFSVWRPPQGRYAVLGKKGEHSSPLAGILFHDAVLFGENGVFRADKTRTNAEQTQTNADKTQTNAERTQTDAEQTQTNADKTQTNADKNVVQEGGIVLSAEDARALFKFADPATEVIILSEAPPSRALSYEEALFSSAKNSKLPRITASAALVADIDTGESVFEKSADAPAPIASITKLFTALVVRDTFSPKEKIAVSRSAFNAYGGNGGLLFGDAFYADELLYPLLMESSNDAAEAFAEAAGREKFISAMNKKAGELGLLHTSFHDPSGLSEENISTVSNLFSFAQFLLKKHPDILALTTLLSYELPAGDLRAWSRTWRSNNEFVRDGNRYLIGTKNGYTDEAAQTTLSLFALPVSETKMRRIAVALLGSGNREGDVKNLLAYAGAGTLYEKPAFALDFRKLAETHEAAPQKESAEFRLALLGAPGAEKIPADASRLFENLFYLKSYDAVFVSLDGVFEGQGYNIAGESAVVVPKRLLHGLETLGADVVAVASAHAGDWGRSAFGAHVGTLKDDGFQVAGGSEGDGDSWQTPVIEKNGIKLGFLNVSDEGPEWLAEDTFLPSIFSAKDPRFAERVRGAAEGVDHLVVAIAFDEASPDAEERKSVLAHAAINAGARVVVGFSEETNPQQEIYKDGLIFYGQKESIPTEIVFGKNGILEPVVSNKR